jgi:predicted dehydrogenase
MNTVRIGFVGVGGIAQAHIKQLREVPQAEIVAVCDIDKSRAETTAGALNAAVYTDGARLIALERLDALYTCVPPNAHGDLEIMAARKGIHLFVEKPVNLRLDAAHRVSSAIRETGVMSQAGYVLRYRPVFVRMREFLQDKEVGAAQVVRWNGLVGAPWWRRYAESGGQLVEMTTHQVDLLRWFIGEVEWVSASYSLNRLHRDDPTVTIPDSQAVLLRFRNGAVATINTSCAIGEAWHGGMDFAIENSRASVLGEEIVLDPPESYPLPPEPPDAPGIDESFVRAIVAGDRSVLKSPYEDAIRTLAVTLAANRSAEEGGRPVHLEALMRESQE